MATTNTWRHSREIEHAKNQDTGLARAGGRAKACGPAPLHPGFQNRTNTSLGAPPTGAPPDASSPLPTDPTKQHGSKQFPVPGVTRGMEGHKNDPERGSYDPSIGAGVMSDAHDAAEPDHPVNMQKRLAASLPSQTNEET